MKNKVEEPSFCNLIKWILISLITFILKYEKKFWRLSQNVLYDCSHFMVFHTTCSMFKHVEITCILLVFHLFILKKLSEEFLTRKNCKNSWFLVANKLTCFHTIKMCWTSKKNENWIRQHLFFSDTFKYSIYPLFRHTSLKVFLK